ncbi:family 43 glycosylhydrolase [Sphingobacterium arenae]|uniref:Family 43 glycosylhydrolase n=1 Tax=Sphingobacterium arenae TaxID=1280598 RepID=A0ABR7Y085_9SPHI|nr:family 43 glycosylhydrolase [Sphingobacterium arenae]MBD1424715.1 family 43 glycosylhydrolase [Sphingobacterium arenae]
MIQRLIIIFLFACITICSDGQTHFKQPAYDAIHSGVPWFDQHRNTVSAHGAGIIKEGDRYYLFGEFKTDSANVFNGFACYSSTDLYNWTFECMALPVQEEGKLGPNRVGERPKVMKSPTTGEYVMFMHVDSLNYKDQYVGYATAQHITGPYTFKGPILYEGKPVRRWDMGAFQDEDGTGYLLVHHGDIYQLTANYRGIEKQVASNVPGMGESPAMLKKNGVYFLLSSNLTSWERNDNQYHTARNIAGPWTEQGLFAPEGSLTWNSQCSFVLPIMGTQDTTFMYMGDRWSFPKQNSAATYVWQPLEIDGEHLSIPAYQESWTVDLSTGQYKLLQTQGTEIEGKVLDAVNFQGNWKVDSMAIYRSDNKDDHFSHTFTGTGLKLYGVARPDGGYAKVCIRDQKGNTIIESVVDMYCLYPTETLKFVSPALPKDTYTVVVTVMGERGNWSDKRRSNYGSAGYAVALKSICIQP